MKHLSMSPPEDQSNTKSNTPSMGGIMIFAAFHICSLYLLFQFAEISFLKYLIPSILIMFL